MDLERFDRLLDRLEAFIIHAEERLMTSIADLQAAADQLTADEAANAVQVQALAAATANLRNLYNALLGAGSGLSADQQQSLSDSIAKVEAAAAALVTDTSTDAASTTEATVPPAAPAASEPAVTSAEGAVPTS